MCISGIYGSAEGIFLSGLMGNVASVASVCWGWCAWNGGEEFSQKNRARVRVCRKQGRFFEVAVGFRQGCMMSPCLFN